MTNSRKARLIRSAKHAARCRKAATRRTAKAVYLRNRAKLADANRELALA